MYIIYAFLIIIIIVCLALIAYIFFYNDLQDCKIKIDEAECLIDEALRNKYDLLLKLETLIKNNIKETKINFKDLNDLKKESLSNFQLERKLVDTLLLISKIQDDFPELEEIKEYRDYLNDIRVMDEQINAAKKFYNKYTSKSNELVRKFPSNIIAKFHNISIRNFFDNKDLNSIGKLITIALMFLGKIGTISFFTLMSGKSKDKNLEYVEGKLIL